MLNLPKRIRQVVRSFEEALSERVWEWAKVLLIGAILAPGERTVTAILRVMGLQQEQQFQKYHRVLNRATWSSRALSRLLLRLLIQLFVPEDAPSVVGLDETIERRRGAKIAAKGIYRDPVRSSKEFFVKTSGRLRMSMMLLTPIPWAQRVWALPFFTVLAPVSALQSAASSPTQNAHRLGQTNDPTTAPLAASSHVGDGSRQHLRGSGIAGVCGQDDQSGHHRHPFAPGCGSL
jgi:DDE superfamily endonuclease